jgi:nucleolar protein 56
MFAKCVKLLKNRKEAMEKCNEADLISKLEEIVMDSAKARAVIDASKSSMGMDVSAVDLLNIDMFATRVIALADYRKMVSSYLQDKMASVAPNLATLIGDTVGARLISHAGSLTNLAKYPASTVQILGAEKALFRALKTKGNTPKYGLIFHSSFIGRAGSKNKGRISRFLANKCSIASRIDCFSEVSTRIYGEKLKEQVEDRLKFYETGDLPKKNVDAMQEAIAAVKAETSAFEEVKPKKKKNKKRKAEEMENDEDNAAKPVNGLTTNGNGVHNEEDQIEAPNKKKKRADPDESIPQNGIESPSTEKKKKKKDKKGSNEEPPVPIVATETPTTEKKKKKKKND